MHWGYILSIDCCFNSHIEDYVFNDIWAFPHLPGGPGDLDDLHGGFTCLSTSG
jgi:hypothetical protein